MAAIAAAVLLAWTAYLGGHISHPELRDSPGATADHHPGSHQTIRLG